MEVGLRLEGIDRSAGGRHHPGNMVNKYAKELFLD